MTDVNEKCYLIGRTDVRKGRYIWTDGRMRGIAWAAKQEGRSEQMVGHTGGWTDEQTDRQNYRHINRWTDRQTYGRLGFMLIQTSWSPAVWRQNNLWLSQVIVSLSFAIWHFLNTYQDHIYSINAARPDVHLEIQRLMNQQLRYFWDWAIVSFSFFTPRATIIYCVTQTHLHVNRASSVSFNWYRLVLALFDDFISSWDSDLWLL